VTYVSSGGLCLRVEQTRGRVRCVELTGFTVRVGAFVRISKHVYSTEVDPFCEVRSVQKAG
jgi:hypothetical protein